MRANNPLNKPAMAITVFNLFLMIFLFFGSANNENSVSIGNNCRITDDGSCLKITCDNTTRFIINKSSGVITAGSSDGTGSNTINADLINANSVTGTLRTVPLLELAANSGVTFNKSKVYLYQKDDKLIIGYMDSRSDVYYYWINLTQGIDINNWFYSPTEP